METKGMKALALPILLLAATANNPFYKDKIVPGTQTVSCCRDKDCKPMHDWRYRNSQYEILMDNVWHVPPQRLITHEPTPDGLAHACYTPVGNYINWFCIFIPVTMI